MSRQIITANPTETRPEPKEDNVLYISEFFFDTIQGEGINTGVPAAFLRMQACTLNCYWCDTLEVWRRGNPYTITEILDMMEESGLVDKLQQGHHLVLTGGSPLKQQAALAALLQTFSIRFDFYPYTEVENEAVLPIDKDFLPLIDCWNNSPKLSNSGNPRMERYKPDLLQMLSNLENSWFKFVILGEADWQEIEEEFLKPGLIKREQIILMPEGADRESLDKSREKTVNIAIREGVRYCTREHIVIWNKKTGV